MRIQKGLNFEDGQVWPKTNKKWNFKINNENEIFVIEKK